MTEAPQKSNVGKIVLACGGCLVLFVGFFVVVGGGAYQLTKGAADATHAHVQKVRDGDVKGAYEDLSQSLKDLNTVEQFEAFVAEHPRTYKSTDMTLNNRNVNNNEAQVSGTVTGPEGDAAVTFTLHQDGEVWRVSGINESY
jgi:Domain of unknown function (DUF4864)